MKPNFEESIQDRDNRVVDSIKKFYLKQNMNFLEVCKEDVIDT